MAAPIEDATAKTENFAGNHAYFPSDLASSIAEKSCAEITPSEKIREQIRDRTGFHTRRQVERYRNPIYRRYRNPHSTVSLETTVISQSATRYLDGSCPAPLIRGPLRSSLFLQESYLLSRQPRHGNLHTVIQSYRTQSVIR